MAVRRRCLIVFCLLAISGVVMSYENGYGELDPCKVQRFIQGVCIVVSKCEMAVAALRKGKSHRLNRCGFTSGPDAEEIVCCPTTSAMIKSPEEPKTDNRNTEKRKSQKYCDDISKDSMKNVEFHIIGGEQTKEAEFPHMAALSCETDEGPDWCCGASVISENFLLSAAHCFAKQVKPTMARVGVTQLNDTSGQDVTFKKVILHEEYSPTTKKNDIALLELNEKIKFNDKVYPACLYSENDDPLGLLITGWGKTSVGTEDDRSIGMQKAPVVAVDLAACNKTYATRSMGTKTIDHRQMCASTPPGRSSNTDACWGDSGGPCQIKNKLGTYSIVSIISYGQSCGSKTPGVYTRVCEYLDWIECYVWDK